MKLAEPDLKTALALDPNDELAQWLSGYIANIQGRFDDAVRFHQRARELDPLLTDNTRQLGNVYYRTGRLDEAAAALRSGIQSFPEATTFQYRLGLVLLAQGKTAEALSEFQREQDHSFAILGVPLALDALGKHAEADKYIARAIGDEQVANGAAYQIALVYAARGDKDRAFTWFERAYRQRDAGMLWIKYDPLLKGLRSDPRFAALVAKVGVFD
jgi:serine/threonine-protein kinase